MNRIRSLLAASLSTIFIVAIAVLSPLPASADLLSAGCANTKDSTVCGQAKTDNAQSMIGSVISTALFILGIISVIMIIVGGIRYTLSNGDAGQLQTAKNTVIYACIGLVVAILSTAIVSFLIAKLK